jgi:nitrogen fixation NifU-like protein
LTIFVSHLFNFIQEKSSANIEYYKNIQNIINLKGGLLFKIILKNQCLKFKIQGTDLSDKRIFLGNFVPSPNIISSVSAIKIYVFDKDNRIIDAKFKTFGCGSAIAASSLATEWLKGMTLEEAVKMDNMELVEELNLPPVKIHCSVLAEDAIKSAINDYRQKQGLEQLVFEESHV